MAHAALHQCQCPACAAGEQHPERELHRHMNLLMSRLDEQQRRWFAALESKKRGHGGDNLVCLITGLHVDTIRRGREELDADLEGRPPDRIRLPGAGRPPRKKKDPQIVETLKQLVEPVTGGDPMTEAKYIRRSLQTLSVELQGLGHAACPTTVAELLRDLDYHLRVNVKRFTGPPHPDRDVQFLYIQDWVAMFRAASLPILSVDTKKKELIGNFANSGAVWCRQADEVNAHDFVQDAVCRAAPYGLYEVLSQRGHVAVGTSADTPAFAADAIAWWWGRSGVRRYPGAEFLLILADAGGSNGYRPRLWKKCLQERLADRYGLVVTVCHYPTGASKWNPVEHRLFSPITTNWAGQPLRTVETMLACIRGTQTAAGLNVRARQVHRVYRTGVKVSAREMRQLDIEYHMTCPQWNYTIWPRLAALRN